MKSSELREMSDEQLTHEARQAQQELFRMRFQSATERLDAPSNLTKLRRTIARIKTVQREREIAADNKQKAAEGKA
jgi:large subunit ribosomal protein L29